MHESIRKPRIQTLDDVIEALADLRPKLAGNVAFENIWGSGVPIKSEIFFDSKAEFGNGCKYLWNLKDVRKTIKQWYQLLGLEIREMQGALVRPSRYYGLVSLPNEIFMHIMYFLAAECITHDERIELVKNLSSVSRHFRDGVVNKTSLWIYWDKDHCLDDGFEHRLARTKEAPLIVDAHISHHVEEKIFPRILPYRTRWQHFHIHATGELRTTQIQIPDV